MHFRSFILYDCSTILRVPFDIMCIAADILLKKTIFTQPVPACVIVVVLKVNYD